MTTVIFGLDGGCLDLIDPWLAEGSLPELSDVAECGVATDMQSCLPPVTCPNWQCYATGTNPGKLGVFWWEHVDRADDEIRNVGRAEAFDGEYFWRSLPGESAAVNLPTSYPPRETQGVHISGGPGAHQDGYTMPPSLEAELEAKHGYAVHPESLSLLSGDDPDNECVDEIYDLIDLRFDVTERLLDEGEYELLHVTVFYLNVLHHFFWDHDVVKTAWERIDERIGAIRDRPDVTDVFVMSDHGSNEIDVTFNVNAWLEREGYLVTEPGVSDLLHRVGLTRERIRPALASLGLEWWARTVVPRRVQTLLPSDEGLVDKSAKANHIDWEASTAVGSGQGPLYVLAEDPEERRRIAEELRGKLDGLAHDGRPIVDSAIPATECYEGPYVDEGPDLLLRQAPGVHVQGAIGDSTVFGEPARWRAENKDTGLFLAAGPSIGDDPDCQEMHILDIAPTILHLHGEPVPEDLDGDVRVELFADGTDPATREVRTVSTTTDGRERRPGDADERVTDRLDDLGYLV